MSEARVAHWIALPEGKTATIFPTTSAFLWPIALQAEIGTVDEVLFWARAVHESASTVTACLTASSTFTAAKTAKLVCRYTGSETYAIEEFGGAQPVGSTLAHLLHSLFVFLLSSGIEPTAAEYRLLSRSPATPDLGHALRLSDKTTIRYLSRSGQPPLRIVMQEGDDLVPCDATSLCIEDRDFEGLHACELCFVASQDYRPGASHLMLIEQEGFSRFKIAERN